MIEVAILGAGELGGALAHVLARRRVVRRIQLIDAAGGVARGKALDIMQTGPIEGFDTTVTGSSDISRAIQSTIVVVADAAGGDPQGDPLGLLRQALATAARGSIVCAGADHRHAVEAIVRDLRVDRRRVVGSAPEALAAAVRALVALRANASVRDVSLTILGAPPSQTVISWEESTVAGLAASRMIDEPTRRRIAAQVPALWPPGPHALAHAAAEAVAALCGVSRRTLSCFVAPDDSTGRRARTVALPTRLGVTGVEEVHWPALGGAAQVSLDTAMQL
ncbi:MAG: hypothetical protein AB7Q29_02910 [Vicinamibacterales bacterium]